MKTITWTAAKLRAFILAFERATVRDQPTFTFEDNEFDLGYARYLIEYLDSHL